MGRRRRPSGAHARVRPSSLATGTDRGNEVLAQAAAVLDLPMVANCIEFADGDTFEVTRVRWGGSLLEDARVDATSSSSPSPITPSTAAGRVAGAAATAPVRA